MSYTVIYNGNGASGGTVPTDGNVYVPGAQVTVQANTGGLTQVCRTFADWNTQANGAGTSYQANGSETFYLVGTDVTLYAQWTNPTCALPTTTTGVASNLSATGTTLNGTVSSNGAATTVSFQYGLTTSYDYTATAVQSPLAANASNAAAAATISGLNCNTTYHFRVVAHNVAGTTNGADQTFMTTVCSPGAFAKSSPANAATGIATNPTLSWQASNGTTSYEYCYDTSNDNACTTWTATGSSTSANLSGLSPATTYYWQVRANNAGGTTYADGAGTAYWSFTTAAVAPTATTGAASAIGVAGASLNGTVSSNGASTTVTFEYGPTTSYGSTAAVPSSPVNGSALAVVAVISGLSCNTAYHFRVKAINSAGTTYGEDATFTTGACPGAFAKSSPANAATGIATNPTLSWQASSGTTSYEYCYDTSNDNACTTWTATGSSTSANLSGLSPATTYYWQVRANNAGGTTYADGTGTAYWSFTTAAVAPTATTGVASAIGVAGASLNGTVSSNGATTTVTFEYGPTTSYGSTAAVPSSPVNGSALAVVAVISGLSCNTAYHFRAKAINSAGTTYGEDATFTTGACPGAFAKSGPANAATGIATNPTISWQSSSGTTSYDYCYDTSNDNACTTWTATGSSTSANLSGLSPATTYYWQVRANNAGGTTYADGASAAYWSFTTAAVAPTATTGVASAIGVAGASLNGTVSSNGATTTVTFEYGPTTSYGSTVTATQSPLAAEASNTAVSAPITGLTCNRTYHFRVVAQNAAGTANSADQTFTTAACPSGVLGVSPTALAFGGQSMNTTSPAQTVTISNSGGDSVTNLVLTTATPFVVSHNCGTSVAAGASCTASVTFTPISEGAASGTLAIVADGISLTTPLSGTGEKSLVSHYYQSILRRAPDSGGKTYWESIAATLPTWGASVNETWFAMAMYFYSSAEYQGLKRDDTGFVTDLYRTFFNREPDSGGLNYWTGALSRGTPREVVLASFMFSTEFVGFTQAIFGNPPVRAEVNVVMDFYRGLLGRLPDKGGFDNWLAQIRSAQCIDANAVRSVVDSISQQFLTGGEYVSRGRSNPQFVGDLYNSFLRRGGDEAGVVHWITQLNLGNQTREQERATFLASPEFTGRVNAIIAQGCLR